MTRCTHLVGSSTARSSVQALDTALSRLAPHLLRLSDGETGYLRSRWVQARLEPSRANPDVERVPTEGSSADYEDVPRFKLRVGSQLHAEILDLHHWPSFEDSFPQLQVLRERYGRDDLAFQVGIPGPWELAAYAFGHFDGQVPRELEAAFEDATVRDITRIHEVAGGTASRASTADRRVRGRRGRRSRRLRPRAPREDRTGVGRDG